MQPIWATVRQPRFAMSFGMAFFSLSVALSVLGVKPSDLRQLSLRPAAIRHTYYNTQARVVRYYENIRFVYEVESRVREFKRNVAPAEPLRRIWCKTRHRIRKTIKTTQLNSPSRSRIATIARRRIIWFWPALRWVHLSSIRQIRGSACSVGDHLQEVRMNCATHSTKRRQ